MGETLTTAFSTAFTSIQSDAMAMLGVIVPIAVAIAGTIFVARKAMGWFKGMAK